MDLKIDFGPWNTVFSGNFNNHEVEVVKNPDDYYITLIYEKKEGKKTGALIEGHKALVGYGPLEGFVQTVNKPCIGIIKTNGEKTTKMFFLSFEPTYVNFQEEDYLKNIDKKLKNNIDSIPRIINMAKNNSLNLEETKELQEADYAQIIGDPFLARSLLSGLKKSALEMINVKDIKKSNADSMIPLGLSKNKELIYELCQNLEHSVINGQSFKEIASPTYIIAENLIINNKSLIIFDFKDYFSELSTASKNDSILQEEQIGYGPAGFPIKKYTVKENIKIPFGEVDLNLIFQKLHINKSLVENFENDKEAKNPSDALETIGKKLNDFEKLRAERIVQIINEKYGDLFGETISFDELIKKWNTHLGRATILNMNELNKDEIEIFENAFIKNILGKIEETAEDLVCIFPNFSNEKRNIDLLSKLNEKAGIVVGTQNPLTIKNTTKIQVVNGRDIAVSTKDKKQYRVLIRPSLSGSKDNY